jgi:Zn-dependent peptidase ImmA (M78 family)
MKIPSTIKIGAVTYKVIQAKKWLDSGDTDGMLDLDTNTIYINSDLSREAREITFFHECMHAMNSTMNHEFLDSFAEQLYALLIENSLLK